MGIFSNLDIGQIINLVITFLWASLLIMGAAYRLFSNAKLDLDVQFGVLAITVMVVMLTVFLMGLSNIGGGWLLGSMVNFLLIGCTGTAIYAKKIGPELTLIKNHREKLIKEVADEVVRRM